MRLEVQGEPQGLWEKERVRKGRIKKEILGTDLRSRRGGQRRVISLL